MDISNKTIEELRDIAIDLGISVDGRWKETKLRSEIKSKQESNMKIEGDDYEEPQETKAAEEVLNEAEIQVEVVDPSPKDSMEFLQDLVNRIASNQSPSLPISIRKSRIIDRLLEKGYSFEQINQLELPK